MVVHQPPTPEAAIPTLTLTSTLTPTPSPSPQDDEPRRPQSHRSKPSPTPSTLTPGRRAPTASRATDPNPLLHPQLSPQDDKPRRPQEPDLQFWAPLVFDDALTPPQIMPLSWADSFQIDLALQPHAAAAAEAAQAAAADATMVGVVRAKLERNSHSCVNSSALHPQLVRRLLIGACAVVALGMLRVAVRRGREMHEVWWQWRAALGSTAVTSSFT